MKQDKNNEIDLLLRRMSRRDGNAAPAAELDEKHLDADELSAYAQNALPAAARTRYMQHLAECSSCRKVATELSLSLGTTTAATVETVPAPSGLKAFLASLFSPMVLRYAVPALGVIVVLVVGFVVLRQRQQATGEFVARVDTRPVTAANSQPEAPAAVSTPSAGLASPAHEEISANTTKAAETQKPPAKSAEPSSADGGLATEAVAGAAQPAARTERSIAELRPGVAADAPAPTPAKAEASKEEDKKADEAEKKPAAATASVTVKNEPAAAPGSTNYQRADENANDNATRGQAKTRPEVNGLMSVRNRAAARRAEETKEEDKVQREEAAKSTAAKDEAKESARDDAETRSVAGRQFRKQRGIWVDTAYDSSTATVNMARGSEQFRALVGDEPGIGTIAKQLDGEVIVVWKGRAYRIR